MKKAAIYVSHQMAGMLIEDENGFTFTYSTAYLTTENPQSISNSKDKSCTTCTDSF